MIALTEEPTDALARYDLIIVGGGVVGAGLAVALRDTALRIALIDAKQPSQTDQRLFALTSSSCQLLESLGLWEKLRPCASPIKQVHVSKQAGFGAVRLSADQVALSALGHVLPAKELETVLQHALQDIVDHPQSSLTLYRPAKLETLKQEEDAVELMISTPTGTKKLRARFVIGADGTDSMVRQQLAIPAEVFDYQQSAIVTRTTLHRPHQQIAYERFVKEGAIAMLPLPGLTCATIWSLNTPAANQLMHLSDADFLARLQQTFGYRLGRLCAVDKRHMYPVRRLRASKLVSGNVMLLGNAAHTLHPIAAQGLNLALYEVAALVAKIHANSVGFSAAHLKQIEQETHKQRNLSLMASHRIAQFFALDLLPLNLFLPLGMLGLDMATPLKKKFTNDMMGKVPLSRSFKE